MKIAILIIRSLVGLVFVVFGLNGFLQFLPMPAMPEAAGSLMGAFAATGYFFPLLKATEIIGGVLLLVNRLPALGILLLAPIIVQIFMFHAVLAPGGIALPIFLVLAESFLGYAYWNSFKSIFEVSVTPEV